MSKMSRHQPILSLITSLNSSAVSFVVPLVSSIHLTCRLVSLVHLPSLIPIGFSNLSSSTRTTHPTYDSFCFASISSMYTRPYLPILFSNMFTLLALTQSVDSLFHSFVVFCENRSRPVHTSDYTTDWSGDTVSPDQYARMYRPSHFNATSSPGGRIRRKPAP